MTVQSTYAISHGQAYAGMVADTQLTNSVSKINLGSTIIPYGKAVVTNGEDGAQLPLVGSTAAQFNGVVKYELNRAQADGDVAGAVIDQPFTVITHGTIWVYARVTVAKDDPVFFRVGATDTGDFSNIASSGATAGVAIANAKFLTGGDAGDLVKISLGIGG